MMSLLRFNNKIIEFFITKIRKLFHNIIFIAIVSIFVLAIFSAQIDFFVEQEAEGLTIEERVQIERELKQWFLSLWPFESYTVTFKELIRDKNPNSEYSDVLYTMTIQYTPWFFRYHPASPKWLSSVLAKNKETNEWELVAKICCCMACEEWY